MSAGRGWRVLQWGAALLCAVAARALAADDRSWISAPELRVKREEVFEFARKPRVSRVGDTVTIEFAARGRCDVTVAIENREGKIIRHLASGVLGPNAPEPFQKDSLTQKVAWDGKDDQGAYVDDKDGVAVRVSLGLKPEFERVLLWAPGQRISYDPPIMRPAEEGVYVYEAEGVDHLRLYGHGGDYVRTVYPFPADRLDGVKGLARREYPDGRRLPVKNSAWFQTLLTSGDNAEKNGMGGRAATAMAVQGTRIALAHLFLNRVATDGTTGGLPLKGPKTHQTYVAHGTNADNKTWTCGPTSAAFSPDGKTLYLAGYVWRHVWSFDAHHGVVRMPFEQDGEMELFAGTLKQDSAGKGDGEFDGAVSVACDRAGRVYVADFMNDRVQVFSPDGKFLKSIPAAKPAQVEIHPKTQELYVFSWPVYTRNLAKVYTVIRPTLTRFGPFERPEKIEAYALPLPEYRGHHQPWWNLPPLCYRGAVDGWTDPPTVWISSGKQDGRAPASWDEFNIRLLRPKDGKLEVVRDFGKDVERAAGRRKFPIWNIQMQRLYCNPANGRLYVGEPDSGPANKAFNQLVEADPETGKVAVVDLPFNPEDIAFDLNGLIYMRTTDVVARYDPRIWREVPWDYGEELARVTCGEGGRAANLIAGLVMPSLTTVCFHQGGMNVSAKGHLAVSCALRRRDKPRYGEEKYLEYAKPYSPRVFPGRLFSSTSACVHVWDRRGKLVIEDAAPGMPQADGIAIDKDESLYIMGTPTRMFGAVRHPNGGTETLMKFRRKEENPPPAAFLSPSEQAAVKLGASAFPKRDKEVSGFWVDGADWFYGGVGFAGFNEAGCSCWNSRFALDSFARSFAPEVERYSVAVLDSNGNLILRIGKYGNADDGVPLRSWDFGLRNPKDGAGAGVGERGGPQNAIWNPRSIGGDEVALFHAAFVATQTDRRLFIIDIGNARALSVKLGYHTAEVVPLRDVPDERPGPGPGRPD